LGGGVAVRQDFGCSRGVGDAGRSSGFLKRTAALMGWPQVTAMWFDGGEGQPTRGPDHREPGPGRVPGRGAIETDEAVEAVIETGTGGGCCPGCGYGVDPPGAPPPLPRGPVRKGSPPPGSKPLSGGPPRGGAGSSSGRGSCSSRGRRSSRGLRRPASGSSYSSVPPRSAGPGGSKEGLRSFCATTGPPAVAGPPSRGAMRRSPPGSPPPSGSPRASAGGSPSSSPPFTTQMTNAFREGVTNKVKCIKRIGFGGQSSRGSGTGYWWRALAVLVCQLVRGEMSKGG
jgi:hypothetical protein